MTIRWDQRRIWMRPLIILAVAILFAYSMQKVVRGPAVINKSGLPEYHDPSKIISATVGREFVIALESNPTTGYGWQLARPLDKSRLRVLEIRHSGDKSKRVGAGGQSLWTFQALQAGRMTVSLEYVRSWEKKVPPAKKADFVIEVKE